MIGDPTRARMLSALMGGEFLAAGELAAAAGVSAQTASAHIAKLLDAELVVLRTQGRHRYVRLADEEVAHALEALSFVAERSADADKWEHGADKPLKAARTCYRHIAGELGVALFEGLLARGTLTARGGHYALSEAGGVELCDLGIALPADTGMSRRFAHACFDWSERPRSPCRQPRGDAARSQPRSGLAAPNEGFARAAVDAAGREGASAMDQSSLSQPS